MTIEAKPNTLVILFFSLIFMSCNSDPYDSRFDEPVEIIEKKIIVSKKQKLETSYHHVFSAWKMDFVFVPKVETAYYFVYSDGTYESVNMGKYSILEIGDTVVEKHYNYLANGCF